MLSGIKKGKRKRQSSNNDNIILSKEEEEERKGKDNNHHNKTDDNIINNKNNQYKSNSKNQNAADELRQLLAGVKKSKDNNNNNNDNITNTTSSSSSSRTKSAIERYEQRSQHYFKNDDTVDKTDISNHNKEETVILMNSNISPILSKEDFKIGARKGKLKQKESYIHSSVDKSIADMVQEEKQSKQNPNEYYNMDEVFARNVARLGSKYKGNDFKMVAGSTAGADEDDENGNAIDMKMFTSISDRLTDAEKYNRELSRQVALSKKQSFITNKCWWWIESESFEKHRLLALGDHVSLVFVPSHLQLVQNQCYIVPLKHAESFVSCEDEVWDEVQRFKTSLREMFRKQDNLGVLFCETVLSTKSLWQARIEVIPVPLNVEQDAEM